MHIHKLLLLMLLIVSSCIDKKPLPAEKELISSELLAKATAIHNRVLTLDTHNDININNFTDSIN